MKAIWLAFAITSLAADGTALSQPMAAGGVKSPGPNQAMLAANPLDVNGARLGMTLPAWKALPYPSGPSAHLATSCTAATGSQGGLQRASQRPGALVCAYVARYGKTVLQQSFPLTADLLAQAPSYVFVDGRLSRIEFRTSINAFNNLDAMFTARFGAPVQTRRDTLNMGQGLTLPRVRREWRTAREDVWIVDPSARLDQLMVRYSLANGGKLPKELNGADRKAWRRYSTRSAQCGREGP